MENREAIKIINQYDMNFYWNVGEPIPAEQLAEAFDLAISALEKQEQGRWTPVTERLPEEEGCYLVTVKNDHERRYSKTAWYSGDGWITRQDIIAWRMTPEPYREEES